MLPVSIISMKTVLAFGTFDILHPGHLSYLGQARQLGNRLVVVVATDKNVEKIKGKKPVNSAEARREIVSALRIVDEAFIGFEDDMIKSVEKVRPGVVTLGYDQPMEEERLKKTLAERGLKAKVVRLKAFRPEEFKSSKIMEKARREKG